MIRTFFFHPLRGIPLKMGVRGSSKWRSRVVHQFESWDWPPQGNQHIPRVVTTPHWGVRCSYSEPRPPESKRAGPCVSPVFHCVSCIIIRVDILWLNGSIFLVALKKIKKKMEYETKTTRLRWSDREMSNAECKCGEKKKEKKEHEHGRKMCRKMIRMCIAEMKRGEMHRNDERRIWSEMSYPYGLANNLVLCLPCDDA